MWHMGLYRRRRKCVCWWWWWCWCRGMENGTFFVRNTIYVMYVCPLLLGYYVVSEGAQYCLSSLRLQGREQHICVGPWCCSLKLISSERFVRWPKLSGKMSWRDMVPLSQMRLMASLRWWLQYFLYSISSDGWATGNPETIDVRLNATHTIVASTGSIHEFGSEKIIFA